MHWGALQNFDHTAMVDTDENNTTNSELLNNDHPETDADVNEINAAPYKDEGSY